MAKTKEILVNGLLTQVTEFDHSAQEIDDAVGKVEGGKFAPAGYGLGTSWGNAPDLDANKITGNGVYAANQNVPTNGTTWIVHAIVGVNANSQVQYAIDHRLGTGAPTGRLIQRRVCDNGTWLPWEYINPPMQLGVEYRTTERYLGKPVYVKAVNYGAMPNASRKNVAHGITNLSACIDIYGSHNQWNFGVPEIDFLYANEANISMKTNSDCSAYTATVVMKYTKTTD